MTTLNYEELKAREFLRLFSEYYEKHPEKFPLFDKWGIPIPNCAGWYSMQPLVEWLKHKARKESVKENLKKEA